MPQKQRKITFSFYTVNLLLCNITIKKKKGYNATAFLKTIATINNCNDLVLKR